MDIDYKNQIITADSGSNSGLIELTSSRGLKIVTISSGSGTLVGQHALIKYSNGMMSYHNGSHWIDLIDVSASLAIKLDKHSSIQLGTGSFVPSKTSDYELSGFHVNMAPSGTYTTTHTGNKYLVTSSPTDTQWASPHIQDSAPQTGGFVDFREPYIKFRRAITISAPTTWTRPWNAGFSNAIRVSSVGYPTAANDASTLQYLNDAVGTMVNRTSSITGIANTITDLHTQLAAKFNSLNLPDENWKLVALQAAVRLF